MDGNQLFFRHFVSFWFLSPFWLSDTVHVGQGFVHYQPRTEFAVVGRNLVQTTILNRNALQRGTADKWTYFIVGVGDHTVLTANPAPFSAI